MQDRNSCVPGLLCAPCLEIFPHSMSISWPSGRCVIWKQAFIGMSIYVDIYSYTKCPGPGIRFAAAAYVHCHIGHHGPARVTQPLSCKTPTSVRFLLLNAFTHAARRLWRRQTSYMTQRLTHRDTSAVHARTRTPFPQTWHSCMTPDRGLQVLPTRRIGPGIRLEAELGEALEKERKV